MRGKLLVASLMVVGIVASSTLQGTGPGPVVLRVLGLTSVPQNLNQTIESLGGFVVYIEPNVPFAVVATDNLDAFAQAVQALPYYAYLVQAGTAYATSTPNDPLFPQQWNLPRIRAPDAWDLVDPNAEHGVVVAVVDTGVDYNHNDLKNVMWNGNPQHGYDFTTYGFILNCLSALPNLLQSTQCFLLRQPSVLAAGPMDYDGHGTKAAGTLGAERNNGIGVAGVTQPRVMAVKSLISGSSVFNSDALVAVGIATAAASGAKVISLSVGAPLSVYMEAAINFAHDQGAVLVAAAGNSGAQQQIAPCAYEKVICVTSLTQDDVRRSDSNFGPWVDLAAPGTDIWAPASEWYSCFGYCHRDPHGYELFQQTSSATPHVAATAALMIAKNPALTNDGIKTILQCTATDLGTPGFDPYYGWGRVNAYEAVSRAIPGCP